MALWRFDIATSTWKHIENVRKEYSETRAVLTSDAQNVIIVGTSTGLIDVLDIQDDNDYKVTRSMVSAVSPIEFGNASAYPVVMKCRERDVIRLTSAWYRKLFTHKQHGHATCSLDIIKLIDQFVGEEMLHLLIQNYAGGAVNHVAFHLVDILSSNSAETPTPLQLPGLTISSTAVQPARLENNGNERRRWSSIMGMNIEQCVLCLCALLIAYFFGMLTDWLT